MKALHIFIILTFLAGLTSCEKEKEAPEAVKNAFALKFQQESSIDWDQEKDGTWEAEFKLHGKEITASFSDDGTWLETETEMDVKDVPELIGQAVQNLYPDADIEEVCMIETPDFTGYEIKLEPKKEGDGQEDIEVLIDLEGNVIVPEEDQKQSAAAFTDQFAIENYTFSSTGRNPFFVLEPGYQLILEGNEGEDQIRLEVTVLAETKTVGGIETRIVEEKEMENGELIEISRNYFAICNETSDIFYFGEEVDIYEDGKIKNHEGAWLADQERNRAGIIMPGRILMGARYYQEVAPDVAMDRAEVISMNEQVETPAGTFSGCLKMEETNALKPGEREFKYYAPGVGLVKEESLVLVLYGNK